MNRNGKRLSRLAVGLALAASLLALPGLAAAAEGPVATVSVGAARVTWSPQVDHERLVLTVSRPDGLVVRQEVKSGTQPAFDLFDRSGSFLPDGVYHWELKVVPRIDDQQRAALAQARRSSDPATVASILAAAGIPKERIQSGTFAIADGAVVPTDLREATAASSAAAATPEREPQKIKNTFDKDQVIPDDLIVQGSACVGLDCVNNESFGFDTIRLKENNTRIKFEDTSVGNFPTNDWQLTANDSAGGGSSKFSIEDITGSKVPFTVTAGASTNSIFVDSTGRVGFRTSTPVLDLHVSTSNTPAIRLEQTNAGGFTAQTWDVAGNEANFFVRDVTGGSKLSFRIRPGAPTSSIDISADGDVGIGTASPDNSLHVARSSGTAKILVEETSGTVAFRELLELKNNGEPFLIFNNTNTANKWSNGLNVGTFQILDQADAQTEFSLAANGNLTIGGTLTQNSSREVKNGFTAIDGRDVLARLVALPISTWSYKEEQGVRHMGPVAEDFYASFKLGQDEKGITTIDTAGVAFAAIQGLYQEVAKQNAELKARNAELEGRLAALEKMVQAMNSAATDRLSQQP